MKVTHTTPSGRRVEAVFGKGFLETYASSAGNLPVLHVSGTPEEMGRQYGALVGARIRRNIDRMVALFAEAGLPGPVVHLLLDKAWQRLDPHVPERFKREIRAIARGAQGVGLSVTEEDLQRITAVTNFDLYKREERIPEFLGDDIGPLLAQLAGTPPASCTFFAVWGSRTEDGRMWAHRNLDWVSQTGMHEDRLVTIYRPTDGIPFVTMGYAGVLGALAGMNAEGICLSEIGAFSVKEELDGIPWTLMGRQVLEEAHCLEDGVSIIRNAKHTLGYNYLVADGDPEHFGTPEFGPKAAALETNFACCEVFYENDPKERGASWESPGGETVSYGLPLTEAVLRGDMAFGGRTRALQAADNGPGEPRQDGNPLVGQTYIECHKPMHDMICAYERGEEYVYPLRDTKVIEAGPPRKIGIEEALAIAATVAHNREKLDESDWNVMSVVYAPTDRRFWVSYESCDDEGDWKNAPDSGYLQFDLQTLLFAEA